MTEPWSPFGASSVILEEFRFWVEPLDALEAVRGSRNPVLLLSGLSAHPQSRFSILAWDPAEVLTVRGSETFLSGRVLAPRRMGSAPPGDPFELLRALLPADAALTLPGIPFAGGAIGYLGYGLRRHLECLPGRPPDPLGHPDLWFGLYDAAVVFDAEAGRVALIALDRSDASNGSRARRRLGEMRDRLAAARPGDSAVSGSSEGTATLVTPRAEYLARIGRALDLIGAGDLYQVNLSHRIEGSCVTDPMALFRRMAQINPAPFAAYLDAGPFQVIASSPERFLALQGERAWSSPIKGTRPRGATPEEDARLARELSSSPKERAENVMITDLVRNDLGRVAVPGSVRVVNLCALESFATVHHLVSTIEGRLFPGRDRIDLLKALFPGGSMTGAPKVRAMEVIDDLEAEERGIYAGSIGYLSLDGRLDLNIVIRTLVCSGGRAHLRVGGAIVADSDPDREFRETLDKARALLQVLRAELKS